MRQIISSQSITREQETIMIFNQRKKKKKQDKSISKQFASIFFKQFTSITFKQFVASIEKFIKKSKREKKTTNRVISKLNEKKIKKIQFVQSSIENKSKQQQKKTIDNKTKKLQIVARFFSFLYK